MRQFTQCFLNCGIMKHFIQKTVLSCINFCLPISTFLLGKQKVTGIFVKTPNALHVVQLTIYTFCMRRYLARFSYDFEKCQ